MSGDTTQISNDGGCSSNQTQEIPTDKVDVYLLPEIRKKLEEVVRTRGLTDYTIAVEPGSSLGDNFMGFIGKVTITGVDKNKDTKCLNWIVKTAPKDEMLRKVIKLEILYAREVYMYEHIFPAFEKLQVERSMLAPFNNYPKFVFSHLVPFQESFAMENLKLEGYTMKNRHEPLDYNHVKVLMKTYARFHAVSLALKDQKPDEFAVLADNMKDAMSVAQDNPGVNENYKMMIDSAFNSLDKITDQEVIKKSKKFHENFLQISNEGVNTTNRYSVFGHGDSWVNNMLWKYEDQSDQTKPTKVCLLDFQLARYASPVCDLSYFLFTCTDKALRDKHYDDAIKLYYYTLCTHLVELGSDPEKVFPFSALQDELKRFSIVGMFWTLMVLFAITREPDEIPDMKGSLTEDERTEQWTKTSKNQDKYAKRVRDVIRDACEKGYLDFLQ